MPVSEANANEILDNVVTTLQGIGAGVGETYYYPPKLVVRAPGISPKWFENPEWKVAYFVVAPEERSKEQTGGRVESRLETFIVGAVHGDWSVEPWQQKKITREQTQMRLARDIKRAIYVDFRRGTFATNSELTDTKFSFSAYPRFAIVSTRWEFHYTWLREAP
jgi:hypothetical protein